MGIRFNCGEFLPGQEPIGSGGIKPPTIPVHIPDIQAPEIPFEIEEPPSPPIPPTRIPTIIVPPGSPGGPGGPGGGQPGGGGVGIPGGSTGGGSTGDPNAGGPQTTPSKYRCNTVEIFCPKDRLLPLSERRVKEVRRFCVLCSPINIGTSQIIWPPDCLYDTKQDCELVCNGIIQVNRCIDLTTVFNDPQVVLDPTNEPQGGSDPTLEEVRFNEQTTNQDPNIEVINIELEASSQSTMDPLAVVERSEIFDPVLNFFKSDIDPTFKPVPNNHYPQIFSNIVAEEVEYFIVNARTSIGWDEKYISNLTIDKIEKSLNPNLLNAFKSIHYPGGQLVGKVPFLLALHKHLVTGTLNEFDVNFFLEINERQVGDRLIKFVNTGNKEYNTRAALGIISNGAIRASNSYRESIDLRQGRRQRRLNEDINAFINVCSLDQEEKKFYVLNEGLCLTTLESVSKSLPTGDGDGYYFYVESSDNNCIPLITTSEIENTYYIPPDVRYNALTLMGVYPGIEIISESTDGVNELSQSDSGFLDRTPIYLSLNLSSVRDITTNNPLISRVSASYSILDDKTSIDEHTKNNGFAVTRLNIDYRDPIYDYIKSTSTLSLLQNDVTFRAIKDKVSNKDSVRLARNIPFGIVITPVAGSKFNPFNGASKIVSYGDTITRSLKFQPYFKYSDKDVVKSELKEINLFNDIGEMKVGAYEPNDLQNYIYRYDPSSSNFVNTYFDGNNYTSVPSVSSNHGMSYMVKDVIDYLNSTYDKSYFTWFDVFSRMPLNKVGELMYDFNPSLIFDLQEGYRDGTRITYVLKNEADDQDIVLDPDSRTIVRKETR